MRHETVAEGWAGFARAVMPRDAPPVQRAEMEKAFYAGIRWILRELVRGVGDDAVSEDEAVEVVMARGRECEAFRDRLLREAGGRG